MATYKRVADKTGKCPGARLAGGFVKATLRRLRDGGGALLRTRFVLSLGHWERKTRERTSFFIGEKLLARGGQEQRGARWTKDNAKVTLSRGVLTFPWPRTTFGPGPLE